MSGKPSPAERGLWSGLFNAAMLLVVIGVTAGLGKLAQVLDAPWLPYVVLVVGFGIAMGLFRWSTERSRLRRAESKPNGQEPAS